MAIYSLKISLKRHPNKPYTTKIMTDTCIATLELNLNV